MLGRSSCASAEEIKMNYTYYTYYEGCDCNGSVIFNGNSGFVTQSVPANQNNIDNHVDWLLKDTKDKNNKVVRIVIKHITRL
ncbi:conserved hypothetical protein [Xenorhabdus bovienii str. puntauvense]|uniref:Uncharacterized protein n=3 Tax=Xenorhabdus bovienii TaxID=40576 RepID=A0A077NE28_XENBV|nr:conserved hypothetical protein [Xenorhabdus bovienii str. puntauvense]CDH01978.1 conserved hypothetical protein [Xenorhabdus bovienii str. feltiae Moldova]